MISKIFSLTISPTSTLGSLNEAIAALIEKGLLPLAGATAVGMFAYAGYLIMSANGDPSKAQKGKTLMSDIFIALVIIASSFVVIEYILVDIFGAIYF